MAANLSLTARPVNLRVIGMPNEHVIDFNNPDATIPTWFVKDKDVRILFAAGDWIRNRIPNTQEFESYDIFLHNTRNNHPTNRGDGENLQANIDYLVTHHYHRKLICILDATDTQQLTKFASLFRNKVSEINTLDGRVFADMMPKEIAGIFFDELLQCGGIVHRMSRVTKELLQSFEYDCDTIHRACIKPTIVTGGRRRRRVRSKGRGAPRASRKTVRRRSG